MDTNSNIGMHVDLDIDVKELGANIDLNIDVDIGADISNT